MKQKRYKENQGKEDHIKGTAAVSYCWHLTKKFEG